VRDYSRTQSLALDFMWIFYSHFLTMKFIWTHCCTVVIPPSPIAPLFEAHFRNIYLILLLSSHRFTIDTGGMRKNEQVTKK